MGTGSVGIAFEPGTYTNDSSGRFASAAVPGWKRTSRICPLPAPTIPRMKSAEWLSRIAF